MFETFFSPMSSLIGLVLQVVAAKIPVLTCMGSKDPDFPQPQKEAELIDSLLGGR